jgi:valyl-tRNA synthetase
MGNEEKAGIDFLAIERKWQEKWDKEKAYKFGLKSSAALYSIDTPPPTVSGKMHLGHAFSYTQADFIARYKRMQGFNIFYPFGFDDNGLATERLVEKSRNIRAKDFTREQFIKICLEETKKYEEMMYNDFRMLGLSVDWSLLYRTIDELARKISQKSFIEIYKKKRAYRKEAPSMWCPACETAIAQAELEDVELDSTFNDIVFKLENGKELIIATTRPEMLSSCVAIFIHPSDKRKKELLGKKAKVPLYDYSVPILEDERVDPEKGSGIVMCCTFGDQTDMEWYFAHNLPLKMSFTKDGRMAKSSGKYEGMKIKEARKQIIADLKEAGLLKSQKPIRHTVNVHERCKTEIEIMNAKQWFIKYLDLKKDFLEKGKELKWYPEHMRVRFENWINGLQWDWSISRQRFFGIPFPVWYCKKCDAEIIADEKQLPIDPLEHKPPVAKCSKCGGNEFVPEKDVMDTWATSSLTPQINAKWGVDDALYKKIYPMSLRPQAHDIITLWAFNTIVKGHFHGGKLPWKDIMISGHALDSKGRKMSKSLGNVIEPVEMINKYSADMLRYWACTGTLGEDIPFQEKEFISGKKFMTKLYNAARFVASATKDFDYSKFDAKKAQFRQTDLWILSRLNSVIAEATESLERYEFSKAVVPVRNFFWLEFADYYIEEIKYRIYNENAPTRKEAQYCLVKSFSEVLKMLAPFLPHITEEIMQENFKEHMKTKSIHSEKWPIADKKYISKEAEETGTVMNAAVSLIRKEKNRKGISLNSPLKKAEITTQKEKIPALKKTLEEIKKTMNIETLEILEGKEEKAEITV